MEFVHRRPVVPRARSKKVQKGPKTAPAAAFHPVANPLMESLEARFMLAIQPVISEFLAINATGLRDQDGDASDWIELQNPTTSPINLDGYYLTNDLAQPTLWRVPAVMLNPNG